MKTVTSQETCLFRFDNAFAIWSNWSDRCCFYTRSLFL